MQAANSWDDPLQGNPRYQSLRTLSKSGKCIVQLAFDRSTGERVAIKFTQRGWDASQSKYLLRELLIHQELSACRHPHIVELKEVFLTPVHLAAVMEHVDGLNLQDFLSAQGGRVTEGLGRFLFQQLILALDFCHLRGKVSRGVKLANTMLQLSPGQLPLLKLADFGFSKDTGAHSAPQSQVGTALFVAPEVMHNFNNATYDGAAVDVWAAGIVLFILLFGRHPFLRPEDSGLSDQQQMLALFTRTAASQFCLLPEEAVAITPGCADLLGHILQTTPKTRYTMAQIQAHPWFLQNLPAGATDMNAVILAECATRQLQMNQPQEVIAALVRHGQVMDESVMAQRFAPQPPPVPSPPAAAGVFGGVTAAPGGSTAAMTAGPRQQQQQQQQQQGGHSWGAPPPARLLAASTSSSDRRQEMLYKMQEQQQQLLQQRGLQPPIAVHMDESTSSSHGSFMAAMQQQQQQQQQQQLQQLALLQQQRQQQAAAVSAGFSNQQPQQQQQLSPEVQQQLWQPQQQATASGNSSGATSGGTGPATAATTTAGSGLNAVSATISSQGLHIANFDELNIQPQQQQQQRQRQQSGAIRDAEAAAMYMNGIPSLSKLNSDELEKIISLEGFAAPTSSAAAAAAGSNATVMGGAGQLPMEVFASLNSLPHIPSILPSMRLESLLDPASNPLLGQPLSSGYQQQQQFAGNGPTEAAGAATASGSEQVTAGKHRLAVNSSPGQAAAAADGVSTNPPADGSDADPAAAAAAGGTSDDHDGVLEIPEEYAAFLVDEDDIALARGDEGARARRKRLLSNTGAGVSSLINLRNLSEMLLEGGASQSQLEEGSLWHKICRDMSFRERSLIPGGVGAGLQDLAGDDDEDLMQSLQGLRDMSITKDFGS